MAFQLQDDLLDSFGDVHVFGKKIGGDIKSNKKTFLLIKALELAQNVEKETLEALLLDRAIEDDEKIEKVLGIYRSLNIEKQTQNKIQHYYQLAQENIAAVKVPDKKKQVILEFAEDLMLRVK